MWLVLPSLLILPSIGLAVLFFLNQFAPKQKLSRIEITIYSFAIGYAVLTIIGIPLGQLGLLTPPIIWVIILIVPLLAICFWIYKKRKRNAQHALTLTGRDVRIQEPNASGNVRGLFSSIRFAHLVLFLIFAVGIFLRFETQLTVPWLGDQDPYYHLSFIDSIVAQGTLPSRTFWGFYSYPPSFHVVFATLISATQVDRYILMKIVPEFLGFLCVPAVYVLIKRKYGEWAGTASAAFLAICSFHIYRTNIAIPEPISLLAMLLFFHAITTQSGARKYLLAGLFASMVFLTNVVGILYFLPCVVAIFFASLALRQWNNALGLLKATFIGLFFSGVFWVPTLFTLGLSGIFEGLGPSYPHGAISFTSHTYFSWIGWGACILALVGLYSCLRDIKNSLVLLIPTMFFLFLIEAANNGYNFFETNLLFRGLLFFGTWVSLLAGVGFGRLMQIKGKKIALTALAILVIFTTVSFPVLSGNRYPVNWGYENVDFVYRSYLENYAGIFGDKDFMVYSAEWTLNYGAFDNVIWDKEVPQIGEALLGNQSSAFVDLANEYKIRYLIFSNGTREAAFLLQSNLAYAYYENWHTIVLAIK